MEALIDWLKAGVAPNQIWLYIVGTLIADLLYNFFVIGVALCLGLKFPQRKAVMPINWILPFKFLCFAALEEFLFRFLPLSLVIGLGAEPGLVLLVAAVSSIIFGFCHGLTIFDLLLPGIGGLIYGLLFLKCGGFQGDFSTALQVVIITHALFNGIIAVILFLAGERKV